MNSVRDRRDGRARSRSPEKRGARGVETATLSSEGAYTLFSFADHRLKFRAPKCLRRYLGVRKWEDGYLEVDADYGRDVGVVEEYIDLRPVLKCLMIDSRRFLSPIKRVEVRYA